MKRHLLRLQNPPSGVPLVSFSPLQLRLLSVGFCVSLGGTNAANDSDSVWMRYTSQGVDNSVYNALASLLRHWVNTWTTGINGYDPHQWMLLPLIRASLHAYIALAGCIYMRPKARMFTCGVLCLYCFMVNDGKFYLPL